MVAVIAPLLPGGTTITTATTPTTSIRGTTTPTAWATGTSKKSIQWQTIFRYALNKKIEIEDLSDIWYTVGISNGQKEVLLDLKWDLKFGSPTTYFWTNGWHFVKNHLQYGLEIQTCYSFGWSRVLVHGPGLSKSEKNGL